MCFKMFVLRLIFASLSLNFAFISVSAQKVEQSTIMENFMKLNEKFDYLRKKMEQLEENSSASANNNTQMIKSAIDEVTQKIEVIDNNSKISKSCNVCEPNPCIYGGQCVPILCGKDFLCDKCPLFRSGLRCEKLDDKCNVNKCWVHKDTLYMLLQTKIGWAEAKRKCENEGMTLMMPKEKEQTEFIVNQLRAIYGTSGYFSLGIVKSGSGWKWTDGSDLGSYTGGTSSFKSASGDYYGLLYLHGKDEMWTYSGITYLAYPLCEKRHFAH